jgi:hypothetical protein
MEVDKILQKRVRGMAVRILACIEHTLSCHLDAVNDNDHFAFDGSDLKVVRSEILNAAGDTTRSLTTLLNDKPHAGGGMSLSREMVAAINRAGLEFVHVDTEDVPVFTTTGDFNLLVRIRELVGAGVVYNNSYTCVGIDAVVDSLLPFLDKTQMAGIKIADGGYKAWRNDVCEMYLEGLNDDE